MKHGKAVIVFMLVIGLGLLGMNSTALADKKTVKIGFIGPLTGPSAAFGLGARNSADLAIKQINQKGSSPYHYELVVMDDASDPSTGVAAATKLCTVDKVTAATTHFNSPVGLATIHVFHRYKTPQMFWGGIHPGITNKNNFPEVTRICENTFLAHDMLADWVVNDLGFKTWSIIHDTSSYGTSCLGAMKDGLAKAGGEVLSVDSITVGTQDIRPILSRIKGLKPRPQGIYYGGVTTEAALTRLQMVELGMTGIVYAGVGGFESKTFTKTAGDTAKGVLMMGKMVIRDDSAFAKAYEAEGYKEYYEGVGPYAYEAVNLITSMIDKYGPDDKKLLARKIREVKYQGILGPTKFNEKGQSITAGQVPKVNQDGYWVPWEKSEYAKGTRKLIEE